jgi:hypothetical protein
MVSMCIHDNGYDGFVHDNYRVPLDQWIAFDPVLYKGKIFYRS